MTTAQKDVFRNSRVFFQHMSVGGQMVEGMERLGFNFNWVTSGSAMTRYPLGDTLFEVSNGQPIGKVNNFRHFMFDNGIGAVANIAGLKYCFTDIDYETDVAALQVRYGEVMQELKTNYPNLKLFHVTPPLTQVGTWMSHDSNAKRVQFADWLKQTYGATDAIIDIQEIESTLTNGTRCMESGVPGLCTAWILDSGHPNTANADLMAKAFIYGIYRSLSGS